MIFYSQKQPRVVVDGSLTNVCVCLGRYDKGQSRGHPSTGPKGRHQHRSKDPKERWGPDELWSVPTSGKAIGRFVSTMIFRVKLL